MPKISDIQETPNPNAVKFILREPVSHGTSHSFKSAEEAEGDTLARSIFLVGDVVSVFYMDKMITVEKTDESDWDEVLPALAVPIRASESVSNGSSGAAEKVGGAIAAAASTDDPVIAGDNVTLRFTIDNTGGSAASAIAFTDDLRNVLPGAPDLTVAGGTGAVCGGTLTEAPTGFLSFSGGSVAAASSCSFDVTLTVPGGTADGSYGNVTSNLTATYGAAGIIIAPATDTLEVSSAALLFSKEFTDDPIVAGNTGTLEFTIENPTGQAATALTFTDDLDAALSGLAATGLPVNDVCGAGSQISGTSLLTLTGGSIGPGSSCTFTVSFVVPGAAATGG